MRKRLCLTLCAAVCLSAAAPRAEPEAASLRQKAAPAEVRCDLWAYTVDPDPAGLNVRSGPGKQFAVVGRLPNVEYSLEVHVIGASGEWLRIGEASTQETGESVFKGEGWVYGPMLATGTKDYTGLDPAAPRVKIYKEPSVRSAVLTRLPNETEVNLVGCKGRWARVRHQKTEGWLAPDSQCHSTLTTCS